MKVVGLTGGIASGKSTVAKLFLALGARLIDADRLAREVVLPDRPAWREIVALFGEDVLLPDRSLNREKLGDIVFNHPHLRQKLNQITHPRIGAEMLALVKGFQAEGAAVVLIDAALLLESPATQWIKPVVVVVADEKLRAGRIMARDGLTREQALARIRAQMTDAERRAKADYFIENSGSRDELSRRVEQVWAEISGAPLPRSAPHPGGPAMTEEKRKEKRRKAARRTVADRRKNSRPAAGRRSGERRRGDRRKKTG